MNKAKKLTIYNQLAGLKKDFGFGESKIISGKTLQWIGILKSSPIGDEYKIKLTYSNVMQHLWLLALQYRPMLNPIGQFAMIHLFLGL